MVVCGEGGSGGALGIAVGDRVLMQQFAIFSVIPPEGCSAILWRDANRKVEAAAALELTAPNLLEAGIIDRSCPSPWAAPTTMPTPRDGGDAALRRALDEVSAVPAREPLNQRYQRLRNIGRLGADFTDALAGAGAPPPAGRRARSR